MIAAMSMPTFVDLDRVVQDIVVFLIVAALLALVVTRSRQSVMRQATLERERGNLARYFPPATVDRLARPGHGARAGARAGHRRPLRRSGRLHAAGPNGTRRMR